MIGMQATNRGLPQNRLAEQNRRFSGTGGVSRVNRSLGFLPGFKDSVTVKVYRACYANGTPAPFHMLEGLPVECMETEDTSGGPAPVVVKSSVIAGFILDEAFYSREEAARAVQRMSQ
jgi:hypothetical protein